MEGFAEGYSFFEKNSGSYTAAAMGDAYVHDVADAIGILHRLCMVILLRRQWKQLWQEN